MFRFSWKLLDILKDFLFYCPHAKFIFFWTCLELSLVEVSTPLLVDHREHEQLVIWKWSEKSVSYSLSEGSEEWAKDRKSRPIQQEDEYRLHMELNRCLKKDTTVLGTDPDLFESQTTRTVSSRGWTKTLFSNH